VLEYLKTEEDSRRIVDRFNGFHDGFIHKLILRSRDAFEQEGTEVTDIVHQLTGRFDVRLDIAHYNYDQGLQPHDRIVRCFFKNVQDFCLDLRSRKSYEWLIKNMEMTAVTRVQESGEPEAVFSLNILWSKPVDQSWEVCKSQLLTFQEAEFEERTLSGLGNRSYVYGCLFPFDLVFPLPNSFDCDTLVCLEFLDLNRVSLSLTKYSHLP